MPEQHLGAVDVADPGQHRLVHQQVTERAVAAMDPAPRPLRVGVRTQRVRPERVDHAVPLVPADQRALDGTPQVGVRRVVLQPQSHLADRQRRRTR